jgi:hypothetical protein
MISQLKIFFFYILLVFSVALIGRLIFAGDLANINPPASNFYTLEDIYNKLSSGTTATEGDHPLSASAAIAGSMYTLTDIWDLISPDQQDWTNSTSTVLAGYYPATTTDTLEADLLPENIKIGVTILGVTGTYEAEFNGGDGSAEDPYQIESCNQLQNAADHLASNFILNNDIDCSDTVNWNGGLGFDPIGYLTPFTGIFDGNGHEISDLYINRSRNRIGLFGMIDTGADIHNLVLSGVDITGQDHVGALAGLITVIRRWTVCL